MHNLSSDQGSNPCPLQWKRRVLTTGLPWKSLSQFLYCRHGAFLTALAALPRGSCWHCCPNIVLTTEPFFHGAPWAMSVPQTICLSIRTYVLKDCIYNSMHWLITIIHFLNFILFPTHMKNLQFIVHICIFLPGFLQIPVACRQIPFLLIHPPASSFEMVT